MDETEHTLKCEHCHRVIQLGKDVITFEKGVVGPRGVVPLGDVLIFCSEEHLRKYLDNGNSNDENDIGFRIPY